MNPCGCGCGEIVARTYRRGHAHRVAHPMAGKTGEQAGNYRHGKRHTATWNVWQGMKQRCLHPNNKRPYKKRKKVA